jgi:hypothetical protein
MHASYFVALPANPGKPKRNGGAAVRMPTFERSGATMGEVRADSKRARRAHDGGSTAAPRQAREPSLLKVP